MIVPFKANSLMEPMECGWDVVEDENGEYGFFPFCPQCNLFLEKVSTPCPHCGQRFTNGEIYD